MGELFLMQQPRRRSPLPATLGILGSSKGNTYAVGSQGTPGAAPAVGPVSAGQVASVLQTLNNIANAEPPQRISATGETLPSSGDKARTMPRWVRPSPTLQPPPVVYVPVPYPPMPYVAPAPPFPGGGGGGGGGGGAAAGDDQGAAADPPVFLGLTQKQLLIGGGLALGAFLLLRKKKGGAPAPVI